MSTPPMPLSLEFERRPPPSRDIVVAALRDFFSARPEVRLAYLFGSLAKDHAGALSDVDVAVLVDRETLARSVGFDYEATLNTNLMAALRFPKIDLALLNGAPSLLRFMVVRDGILVREREAGLAIEFRVEAIRDYIDFEPARRIQRFYLRKSLGLPPEPHTSLMSPDRAHVERRLKELARLVAILRRHSSATPEALRRESERVLAIEHGLQLAIQCLLDVASHLVAARVVSIQFAERIEKMAGLRNVLVHMYLEVDLTKLTDALRRLDDFDEFSRYALLALDRAG